MSVEETMEIITKQWCNLTDLMKNGGGGIEFAFNANYKSYTGVDNCEREKYYGLTKES